MSKLRCNCAIIGISIQYYADRHALPTDLTHAAGMSLHCTSPPNAPTLHKPDFHQSQTPFYAL